MGIVPNVYAQNMAQLVLRTALDSKLHETIASATLVDDSGKGFDPGIYITCNGMPIVDTRPGNIRKAGPQYVSPRDSMFEWSYEGLDTNFEVEIPADPQPVIPDSLNEKTIYISDSLSFAYVPKAARSELQLILTDEFQDTVRPTTNFDTATGELKPTWINSLGLQSGAGTIALARSRMIYFTSPRFRWVVIQDNEQSEPVNVIWQ